MMTPSEFSRYPISLPPTGAPAIWGDLGSRISARELLDVVGFVDFRCYDILAADIS